MELLFLFVAFMIFFIPALVIARYNDKNGNHV